MPSRPFGNSTANKKAVKYVIVDMYTQILVVLFKTSYFLILYECDETPCDQV